jgi:acylphosphatase
VLFLVQVAHSDLKTLPLMLVAKRCFVAGRVQGVYYRATARQKADELAILGYARNLGDGRVEVLAVGQQENVDAFTKWLWQGSPASHVTQVEILDLSIGELGTLPAGFTSR